MEKFLHFFFHIYGPWRPHWDDVQYYVRECTVCGAMDYDI